MSLDEMTRRFSADVTRRAAKITAELNALHPAMAMVIVAEVAADQLSRKDHVTKASLLTRLSKFVSNVQDALTFAAIARLFGQKIDVPSEAEAPSLTAEELTALASKMMAGEKLAGEGAL